MAEIRVEPHRKSRVWLWIVAVLVVIAIVLYFVLYKRNGQA